MPSVLSNYAGNAMLHSLLFLTPNFLACHTSDPTVTGLLATEVSGGGYGRASIRFTAPGSKTIASGTAQTFTGMPACTVTYLAVWTAISGGSMIFSILLGTPLVVPESGQVLCAVGDIAITL